MFHLLRLFQPNSSWNVMKKSLADFSLLVNKEVLRTGLSLVAVKHLNLNCFPHLLCHILCYVKRRVICFLLAVCHLALPALPYNTVMWNNSTEASEVFLQVPVVQYGTVDIQRQCNTHMLFTSLDRLLSTNFLPTKSQSSIFNRKQNEQPYLYSARLKPPMLTIYVFVMQSV